MGKNIKKLFKYFIILIGIVIALPTVLSFVLRIPEIQTLMIRRVTGHLSEKLKSTISVGKVNYRFFNNLNLNDILIKDQNNDTLFFSENVSCGIRKIDLNNKTIILGRIVVINPVVELITDSSGVMNLTRYLDLLKPEKDTLKKGKSSIIINQIDLRNARFALINRKAVKSKSGLDFNNLHISGLNSTLEDLIIRNDTTSFSIYNLGFSESGGFRVNRLNTDVVLTKDNFLFKSALINCDSSILNIDHIGIHADSSASFKYFIDEVRLDILLNKSRISTADLQYFVPAMNGMNESLWISGKILGTVSEIRGRNIEISYREHTRLDFNFDISGLPQIENSFIYFGVNDLRTNAIDLGKIIIPGKGPLELPEFYYRLGTVVFEGSFTGFTTDFVTYGKIITSKGTISTDISLRPEESNRFKVKGMITGNAIELGQISGNPDFLGNLSIRADVDGYAYSLKKFNGNLTGTIDSVEINKYTYRNILLNGSFSEKTWDGHVKIFEDNIKMDLLGMFSFREKLPEFDFTLNLAKADLRKLNFDKSDTTSSLSMLLTANFKGNNIDNLDGEIKLLNSNFKKYGNILELYNFSIRTFTENNKPAINLRTDYVDADVRGYYNFAGLGVAFKSALYSLMPTLVPALVTKNSINQNNFTFNATFRNTDKINNFLHTGILISPNSSLSGAIFPDSIMWIKGEAKSLNLRNNIFKDFKIEANLLKPELSVKLRSSSLLLLGQSELKSFAVNLDTKPDSFNFALNWDNQEASLSKGNFIARGLISKNDLKGAGPVLKIYLDSTFIYIRDNLWKINNSSLSLDSNAVNISNLNISNKDRYYRINGSISENPADTLYLEFKGIDISPLNYLVTKKNDPYQVPLSFKGQLDGKILLTNVYRNPLIESNLKVSGFSLLQSEYGDLSVISAWNNEKKVAEISAGNNLGGKQMITISGFYDPGLKKVNLDAIADKLPVDALNPLLKMFASGIAGTASGKVNFSGQPGKVLLNGALMAENTIMKIDYLQAKFKINDSIRFDNKGIKFSNVKVSDEKGNPAILSGYVYHKNFKEYSADLTINIMAPSECLVLNTQPKDNDLFYGTAYTSGVTTIKSGPSSLSFDISAKTGKNTLFNIPLNTSETVSDYSFITFITHDTLLKKVETTGNNVSPQVTATGMDINFDLEITPEAEVKLIFDSKLGDEMQGTGSGNLNLNLNSKGDFKIFGDYIIDDGTYLFTLGNFINKKFVVENGGKITFNGDIENAEIDIKAVYSLKTSLFPILQDERFNERINVECQINLSGNLFNPIVDLNIYLPMADESTRSYLANAITTEEEKNRQFLYLLVMNSFYSEQSAGSTLATAGTGTSAMAVTTTEMISNQLSNWISQISNDFNLGFVYRPGKDINPQEVQVALSTQLLNDKVTINGNFDVRGQGGATGNTDQLTGDFDVEYKLTDKIRFKVFNRFNNPYTGKQAPYTQGFGFFYKQDFNKFSDLFTKKEKSKIKKVEAPATQQP